MDEEIEKERRTMIMDLLSPWERKPKNKRHQKTTIDLDNTVYNGFQNPIPTHATNIKLHTVLLVRSLVDVS